MNDREITLARLATLRRFLDESQRRTDALREEVARLEREVACPCHCHCHRR